MQIEHKFARHSVQNKAEIQNLDWPKMSLPKIECDKDDDEAWLLTRSNALMLPQKPKSESVPTFSTYLPPPPPSTNFAVQSTTALSHGPSILSLLEPIGVSGESNYSGPLSLQESAETPLLARQRTVELLRSQRSGVSVPDKKSAPRDTSVPLRKLPSAPASARLQKDASTGDRCVACAALAQNSSSSKKIGATSAPLANRVADESERADALATLKRELVPFVDALATQASFGTGYAAQTRLMRCADALRTFSLLRVADWVAEPLSGDANCFCKVRVLAILHIVFGTQGKRIAASTLSAQAFFVPVTIGEAMPFRDALLRRKIDDLLFLEDDKSCFANDESAPVWLARLIDDGDDSETRSADDNDEESFGSNSRSNQATACSEQWLSRTLVQVENTFLWRCVLVFVEQYATDVANTLLQILNLQHTFPRVWKSLCRSFEHLEASTCARLAYILENHVTALLEFALSGVLFVPQSFERGVQSCYEKMCAFPENLRQKVLASSVEAYEVFWFSSGAVPFERRMAVLGAIEQCERNAKGEIVNAPLARLRANLQRCAKRRETTLVVLLDRLGELHERNMLSLLEPFLADDWREWRDEARSRAPPLSALQTILDCPHTRTLNWLFRNTGLSEAQREMATLDVVALQRRLDSALDANNEPVHVRMVERGLAVDDGLLAEHRTPLPVLVCYERSLPVRNESTDVDYAPVTAGSGSNAHFRAYGVFLYTYSTERSASRFALMMWLSPPYAGEIVLALTPFCQGLIDYYVSSSDRTSAPGFNGLKYYSQSKAKFLPISQLLPKKKRTQHSALGVYNRISHTNALELRRSAQLRQVKSVRVPRPPPVAQSRDGAYLGYAVDDSNDNLYRNYVHPGAAAHLFDAGFSAAVRVLSEQEGGERLAKLLQQSRVEERQAMLSRERENSRALLSTWTQNFFENDDGTSARASEPSVALSDKRKAKEPVVKREKNKKRRADTRSAARRETKDWTTSSTREAK